VGGSHYRLERTGKGEIVREKKNKGAYISTSGEEGNGVADRIGRCKEKSNLHQRLG